MNATAVSWISELLPGQTLLDKALKETVGKIYEVEKTCKKLMLMIMIETTKSLEEQLIQNTLKICIEETLK